MNREIVKKLLVTVVGSIGIGVLVSVPFTFGRYPDNLACLIIGILLIGIASITSLIAGIITFYKQYGLYLVLVFFLLPTGFLGAIYVCDYLDIGYYPNDSISWNEPVANFVIFKPGVTAEQIDSFAKEVFPSGRDGDTENFGDIGYSRLIRRDYEGSKVIYFRFYNRTSEANRERVYKKINSSPIFFELKVNVPSKPFLEGEPPLPDPAKSANKNSPG